MTETSSVGSDYADIGVPPAGAVIAGSFLAVTVTVHGALLIVLDPSLGSA